jgi:hypothetical protein
LVRADDLVRRFAIAARLNHDKDHREALQAFIDTCASEADALISWADLRASSLAAILAERSTREGAAFEVVL